MSTGACRFRAFCKSWRRPARAGLRQCLRSVALGHLPCSVRANYCGDERRYARLRFGATSWLANALARLVAQSRHPGPGPRSFEGGASATRIKSSTSSHPRRKLSRKGRSGRNAASKSSRSTERWFVSQVGIEMSELDASPFSKGGAGGRRHENHHIYVWSERPANLAWNGCGRAV